MWMLAGEGEGEGSEGGRRGWVSNEYKTLISLSSLSVGMDLGPATFPTAVTRNHRNESRTKAAPLAIPLIRLAISHNLHDSGKGRLPKAKEGNDPWMCFVGSSGGRGDDVIIF
jgi:hypothetical protein